MKCPSCGHNNIDGVDECEKCHEDLASLDGVAPRGSIEEVLMSDAIAKLNPRTPLFVSSQTNILEAVHAMNTGKVGCVLVGNVDHLEGILTEHDVVIKGMSFGKNLKTAKAADFMTSSPETLTHDDSLAYAVNKMSVGGYRHIPILKDKRVVGILSIRDVVKYLSRLF